MRPGRARGEESNEHRRDLAPAASRHSPALFLQPPVASLQPPFASRRPSPAVLLIAAVALAPAILALRAAGKEAGEQPAPFEGEGRLVCVAEAMRDAWRAEVPPIHDHVPGFQTAPPRPATAEPPPPAGAGAPAAAESTYHVLLRTPIAEGLFADERFREKTLILRGRVFPRTGVLEVTSYGWIRDGKRYDLYYWCDVCSIRGRNPASCACCQAPVELREEGR